jgi:chromosome segregation ATPase
MPDRNQEAKGSPDEQVRALYEDMESRTAKAFEEAVSKPSFGALLAHTAENVAALTRMGNDLADLVLRNLRIAGRADITRLARQVHRTEDKLERVLQEIEQHHDELERVLQEIEQLHDELAQTKSGRSTAAGNGASATSRRRSSSAKR